MQRFPMFLWVLCLAACDGCGGGASSGAAPTGQVPAPPAPKPAVLEGVVRLAPGAELPSFAIADMERKVLKHVQRAELPSDCTPPQQGDRQPVKLTGERLLSGVMLAASEFSQSTARTPVVHELTIRDCRLTPSLVVALKGDTLRITNEVTYPFMPTFDETSFVQTLTPGQKKDIVLEKGGVQPVLCGFTAPCGRTDVVVLYHTVSAVTDEHGKFRIEDFPADETIEINAWHPLFQQSKLSVKVEVGETKQVELLLAPLPRAGEGVSPATGDEGDGKPEAQPDDAAGDTAPDQGVTPPT